MIKMKSSELDNLSQLRSFKALDINGIIYNHLSTEKSEIYTETGQSFVQLTIYLQDENKLSKFPDAILYSNESNESLTFYNIVYSEARFKPIKIKKIRVYE